MTELNNKVVWITGASSGIGEALSKEFAAKGCRLILSARNTEALEKVRSAIKDVHEVEVKILRLDLSEAETLPGRAQEAWQLFGQIDILVHSGGISQRSLVLDTPVEIDRRLMEINFFGAITLTKAVLPAMIENGFGHIVPISSLTGKFGSPYRSGYAASKHALHGFFDSLRAENYKQNIFVTIAIPGFIRTNISMNAVTETGESLNQMDEAQQNGMSAEKCAKLIVHGVQKKKNEILIGGKETLGVYIKRFFPNWFTKIIRKTKVR